MNPFWIGKLIDVWMQNWLRPLHCACRWGHFLGVKWLVSHGANVDVKDNV